MAEQRLTELETRYSFLERLVDDLSHVLHDQRRTIETLSARVKRLEAIVMEALETPEAPGHEKPPHY